MGAAPPPWLAQSIDNIDQNFNQIHAEMQAGFARIEARQVNAGISRWNRLEIETNTGLIAYRAKQKVVVGDGTLLANAFLVAGIVPLAALPVVPAVGTTIAATISPNNLTHQAILNLIQFYNFDFGIQSNEVPVAIRRQRISNWLATDV
ncbi:hypothetical protein AX14_009691 [Amanita brunnescens Koide BX004]|nr:hypothetical protein AX14_009691 [Amanita brunnescens Koide BX004]